MARPHLLLLSILGAAACSAQSPAADIASASPCNVERERGEAGLGKLPELTGRVVDRAGLITDPIERKLTARLGELEHTTTDQLVVVTTPSLNGEAIEQFGLRLGNGWGIGQDKLDNGVLLIVAPSERRVRIEVGRGLEGLLTDARAQAIIHDRLIPLLRQGRYEQAVEAGVADISQLLLQNRRRPVSSSG